MKKGPKHTGQKKKKKKKKKKKSRVSISNSFFHSYQPLTHVQINSLKKKKKPSEIS